MEIKGIIHCHSTYSYDAKLSLAELKELFQKNGVQFVCMTEHTDELTPECAREFVNECRALSDERFLFIPGFEVPHKRTHILMVGQRQFHGTYAATDEELVSWTKDTPFVILAHPVRNKFLVSDELLEHIDAVEVWNQQYEGKRVPRTRSLRLLKHLRHKKPELIATGGLDFHRSEHLGTPRVTLDVSALDESHVLEKLKQGAFVVSSPHMRFYGSLPNPEEVMSASRLASAFSVAVIRLGKWTNKTFASLGLSLPTSLKSLVRRRL